MKCKVCGVESGKYPLCRGCNIKKDRGEIIKCTVCNNWHYATVACPVPESTVNRDEYLYALRNTLISKAEQNFYSAIVASVPEGYFVFPQINLASFITRTDDARFHNELFRNVDFLITDEIYHPKLIVEINDQTHLSNDRKERDEKVRKICEEAGIPILKLWTSYGVNQEYIKGRIEELLRSLPVNRVHHFSKPSIPQSMPPASLPESAPAAYQKKNAGCYVATCVYGSYDCPSVWVLRRYRDNVLQKTWLGRLFVQAYYATSPWLVNWLGEKEWFVNTCRCVLDRIIVSLKNKGFKDTSYLDV